MSRNFAIAILCVFVVGSFLPMFTSTAREMEMGTNPPIDEYRPVSKTLTIDIAPIFDTIEVQGEPYTRIRLPQGGAECGPNGEERPFLNQIFKTPGTITDVSVKLCEPISLKCDPVPYQLPSISGLELENDETVLDGKWLGHSAVDTKAEWRFNYLSQTTVGGTKGRFYNLKIYPVKQHMGTAVVYTKAVISYTESPAIQTFTRADPGHKPSGNVKYLIITHSSLVEAVTPLAEWKHNKGLFTQIITTEEIDEMYQGRDLPFKMRKHVMELEEKYDLDYLLLAGDWDKVPTRNTRNNHSKVIFGEPSSFATDLYFACVDPGTTWNLDTDSNFAEEKELDDIIPDMAIGRLAINSPTVMTQIIDSLINREKNLQQSADSDDIYFIAGDPGTETYDTTQMMDFFWDNFTKSNFSTRETIYEDGSGTQPFNTASVVTMLEGDFEIMGYFGDGEATELPSLFSTTDAAAQAAGTPNGLMMSVASNTGWFDNPLQGNGMNALENNLGEVLTETPDKGVVGYIGSSRFVTGDVDEVYSPDGPGLMENFYRVVGNTTLRLENPTIGDVWKEMISNFSASFHPFYQDELGNDNPGLRTFLEFNLLGEPEAPLVFRTPESLQLQFTLAPDKSWVSAKVTNLAANPVQGATVAIGRLNELGRSAITDASGEVNITIPKSNGGIVNITASKQGDKPDWDTFTLEDELAPEALAKIDPSSPDGNNGIYVSIPTINITGDEPVDVAYKWDGGTETVVSDIATVQPPEGEHTLYYRVKDKVGLWSQQRSMNITVDMTPPVISPYTEPADPNGEDDWFINYPVLKLSSNEELDVVYIQFDNKSYTGFYDSVIVPEGIHTVNFTAYDLAGNKNTASASFKVDTIEPVSRLNISHAPDGRNGYYITKPTLRLFCDSDVDGRIEYKWDNGPWKEYTSPIQPGEGNTTLYYLSIDIPGNVENIHSSNFLVDTIAPIMNSTVEPAQPDGKNGYYVTNPVVNITTTEGKMYYVLTQIGEDLDWSEPDILETRATNFQGILTIPEGAWSIHVYCEDEAGNSAQITPMDFRVDRTKPNFKWAVSPPEPDGLRGWYKTHPKISRSVVPFNTTIYYTPYGENNWTLFTDPITAPTGYSRYSFKAVDPAGNVQIFDSEEIKVDDIAPWVNIIAPDNVTLYGPSIKVEWIGGDGLSGVYSYEVRLGGRSWINKGLAVSEVLSEIETGNRQVFVRVTDEAGNTYQDLVDFNVDATPPQVIGSSPSGQDISISSNIYVDFSEDMNKNETKIIVEGVEGKLSWNGRRLTFDPNDPLDHAMVYMVVVNGKDVFNNSMDEYRWSFKTASKPIPQVEPPPKENESILPIIAIALLVVAMVVAVVGYLVWKRRQDGSGRYDSEEVDEDFWKEYADEDDEDDEEDDYYEDEDGWDDDEEYDGEEDYDEDEEEVNEEEYDDEDIDEDDEKEYDDEDIDEDDEKEYDDEDIDEEVDDEEVVDNDLEEEEVDEEEVEDEELDEEDEPVPEQKKEKNKASKTKAAKKSSKKPAAKKSKPKVKRSKK